MDEVPYIDVHGLTVKTPMGVVYQDVSFSAPKGSAVALFGDQGSGKTALLLSLCGRMKTSSGSGTIAGFDLVRQYRRVRRISSISFIEGVNDVQPFLEVKDITAAEIALAGKHGNKENTDAFLKKWDFFDFLRVQYKDLDAYHEAAFGIVLALASDPELVFVDDVQTNLTQHQSIKLTANLRRLARECGITVVYCTSSYEIARQADGIVVLSESAELQRRAVLRDAGVEADVPVFGTGNGVSTDLDQPAGDYARRLQR